MIENYLDVTLFSFLLATNIAVLAGIISFGYWNISTKIFTDATCIMFLSIAINGILKILFEQPPLPGHSGFSFPSGHGHAAAAFWLTIMISDPKKVNIVVIMMGLIGVGIGLVYFGHHHSIDVVAGYTFALLTISFYKIFMLTTRTYNGYIKFILSLLYISPILALTKFNLPIIVWGSLINLYVLTFANNYSNTYIIKNSKACFLDYPFKDRIILNLFGYLMIFTIYKLIAIASQHTYPAFKNGTILSGYLLFNLWVCLLYPFLIKKYYHHSIY